MGMYHLVMTNIAMENPNHKWRFRSLGKSFISIDHLYHGYVSHNQKVMGNVRYAIDRDTNIDMRYE